jgi:hypothetical protein
MSGSLVWNTRAVETLRSRGSWDPGLACVTGIVWGWPSSSPALLATKIEYIGIGAGTLLACDEQFGRRLLADPRILDILRNFRNSYIRTDNQAVSFLFAGTENDYSGMIRDFGSYDAFLVGIMDSLSYIADAMPER